MKTIYSRDNPIARQFINLAHSARERKKAGLTVLDGQHLIEAYLDAGYRPQAVAIAETAQTKNEIQQLIARLKGISIYLLTDNLIKEASSLDSPASALAVVETPVAEDIGPSADAVLVLEDVQDPGNIGSMLRSAAAAGVKHILLSKTCAFAWSPKVLRAAQGAHFSLNIQEGADIVAWVKQYQGQSFALTLHATMSLYTQSLTGPTAFLIGNEGAGLTEAAQQAATHCITIPMPGKIESLNAAAAAAICLFERVRQSG